MGTPNISKFLSVAKSFAGVVEDPPLSNNITGSLKGVQILNLYYQATGRSYGNSAWCAVFVSACAQEAGIANIIIAPDSYVGNIYNLTASNYRGTKHAGPGQGVNYVPQPGDLIIYGSDFHHIGIVNYVDSKGVHSIEGNTTLSGSDNHGVNVDKIHSVYDRNIYAYVTPNWGILGDDLSSISQDRAYWQNAYSSGSISSSTGSSSSMSYIPSSVDLPSSAPDSSLSYSPQYLYATRSDRHDMTLRQVGYLSNNYTLVNSRSNIAISVINYTSKLGDLYNTFSTMSIGNRNVSTSNLNGLEKLVVDYLLEQGYNGATACALAGCIKDDSNYKTDASSIRQNTLCKGICQWQGDRLTELISHVGLDWTTNLSGQLQYLMYELSDLVPKLNAYILYQPLDISSISIIVDAYTRNMCYPISADSKEIDTWITNRTRQAEEIYNKLIITQPTIVGTSTQISDINNNPLSPQETVNIPSAIPQTGIIDDYTSYSYWYTGWNSSSPQKKLANMWYDQGCPSDKGIATIGGYYCVAVRPKFGRCGDALLVTLQNGESFPAIICDEKGEDAGSEWGHVKSNGISLIEWQRVKSIDNKVVTLLDFPLLKNNQVDDSAFGSWLKQPISSITNYGKYVNVTWG